MELLAFAVKLWLGGIFVFVTIEKLDARTQCFMKFEPGPCRASIPKWFYNHTAHECQLFIFGGCGGNQNNFATKEKCQQLCQGNEKLPPSQVCSQNKRVGSCRAAFPRWYFDKAKGKCQRFTYGGCGGNQNNFYTESDCEDFCQEFITDRCRQPIIPATKKHCEHEVRGYKFGYNKNTGKCEKFLYSSCKENHNNFATRKDCLETCAEQSPCLRRTRHNSWRLYISYFYDADNDICQKTTTFRAKTKFWPKDNRFRKLSECFRECMPNYTAPVKAAKKPPIPVVTLDE
ncbi:actinia tenebrosa protease inhibitors [Rhipicephalus sanguineus]|uniref:actinia tenebrosa protease inhibitors n=1 Tax=Rhipicephalus sanguineus TaxID=34632 RepID=UPI00189568DC|nr:actinia tenebrosa protease inhibitors [Rhipicephalus sanguineus]